MPGRRGSSKKADLGLLVLRAVSGSLMAGHGAQKLFAWSDEFPPPGLEAASGFMESLGLRPGRPWAYLAGLSEFGGGALTALGLLSPLGPLGTTGAMAMAATTAHKDQPIWVTEGGAELPVINIAAAIALMLSGPGRYSLDRAFGIRLPAWVVPLGLAAVALSVAYGPGGDAPAQEGGDSSGDQPAG